MDIERKDPKTRRLPEVNLSEANLPEAKLALKGIGEALIEIRQLGCLRYICGIQQRQPWSTAPIMAGVSDQNH